MVTFLLHLTEVKMLSRFSILENVVPSINVCCFSFYPPSKCGETNDNLKDVTNDSILTDEEVVVQFQIEQVFANVPK